MVLSRGEKMLVGGFAASGVVHLVKPEVYMPLMPDFVPAHREVILGSGVLELLCAVGLAVPATRRTAGWASTALLLGVWPGNLKMAMDAQKSDNTVLKVVSWVRMPLQVPMIRSALRAARG